ncbi:MAG: methylated-DNA--[protein]-cysteine S-methyltransferase [Lachnospiraceae bacterium]|nr:methylated-DNA--[protein]-cysteine S-methyltransferase [Lachnospiraceae bacterium]
MKPAAYITQLASPVGSLTLASDGSSLTGLWLENQKYFASTLPEAYESAPSLPVFLETARWLDAYFAGKRPAMTLPLAPQGSEFRQAVWRALLYIPFGETTTYGQIAASLPSGGRGYSQAVGNAVAHNPIMILIPCHRVLGANGSLTGYAGGLECKKYLLALEGSLPQSPRMQA